MSKGVLIKHKSENQWQSSTDLMSGLMLVFMFIAISFMINTSKQRDQMKEVAQEWAEEKEKIYESLMAEFSGDLEAWEAEISRDSLIVRFKEPTVLFDMGASTLTTRFENVLSDFFPRYLGVLVDYKQSISEVRIEGHTSSEWNDMVSPQKAYFNNMELSQNRTREVLAYCLSQTRVDSLYTWGESMIIAAGMSSSRLVLVNGKENSEASRRVEFRVRTNADEKMSLILQQAKEDFAGQSD